MELPKNVTQIGAFNPDCKIYMEDYVVSYLKQLNSDAKDRGIAAALYGRRQAQEGIFYYFVYGACRLDFLQREVRHLSQAQQQEIEKLRKRHFTELEFVGYRILDGEMIEGIHLCEQEVCRYTGGYFRFYEKNDDMLAYMLEVREQTEPESVDQSKYEEVKKRQEERKRSYARTEESAGGRSAESEPAERRLQSGNSMTVSGLQRMRMAAVGAFALLCLVGIATFREDEQGSAYGKTTEGAAVANQENVKSRYTETLYMEDKLEQAILTENTAAQDSSEAEEDEEALETHSLEQQPEEKDQQSEDVLPDEKTKTTEESVQAVAYVVQPGDTLTDICRRQYGNKYKITDICDMNGISNPDDIKQGQVLMLPR